MNANRFLRLVCAVVLIALISGTLLKFGSNPEFSSVKNLVSSIMTLASIGIACLAISRRESSPTLASCILMAIAVTTFWFSMTGPLTTQYTFGTFLVVSASVAMLAGIYFLDEDPDDTDPNKGSRQQSDDVGQPLDDESSFDDHQVTDEQSESTPLNDLLDGPQPQPIGNVVQLHAVPLAPEHDPTTASVTKVLGW